MVVAVTVKLLLVVMMVLMMVVVMVVGNTAGEANSLHRSVCTQLKAVKGAEAMQQCT